MNDSNQWCQVEIFRTHPFVLYCVNMIHQLPSFDCTVRAHTHTFIGTYAPSTDPSWVRLIANFSFIQVASQISFCEVLSFWFFSAAFWSFLFETKKIIFVVDVFLFLTNMIHTQCSPLSIAHQTILSFFVRILFLFFFISSRHRSSSVVVVEN